MIGRREMPLIASSCVISSIILRTTYISTLFVLLLPSLADLFSLVARSERAEFRPLLSLFLSLSVFFSRCFPRVSRFPIPPNESTIRSRSWRSGETTRLTSRSDKARGSLVGCTARTRASGRCDTRHTCCVHRFLPILVALPVCPVLSCPRTGTSAQLLCRLLLLLRALLPVPPKRSWR